MNRIGAKNHTLQRKCSRLRDYVRKLTSKCDEWETSFEQQSRVLEALQTQHSSDRERASSLAERYNKLASEVQRRSKMQSEERAKWGAERSSIKLVHTQLEEELDDIAKELSKIATS